MVQIVGYWGFSVGLGVFGDWGFSVIGGCRWGSVWLAHAHPNGHVKPNGLFLAVSNVMADELAMPRTMVIPLSHADVYNSYEYEWSCRQISPPLYFKTDNAGDSQKVSLANLASPTPPKTWSGLAVSFHKLNV